VAHGDAMDVSAMYSRLCAQVRGAALMPSRRHGRLDSVGVRRNTKVSTFMDV
jgi:hypothetical protein